MPIESRREHEAKMKLAYMNGLSDTHPQEKSGKYLIIPYEEGKRISFMEIDGVFGYCGENEYEIHTHKRYYHVAKKEKGRNNRPLISLV